MKSFGYRSNSAKTIDYSKNAMDSYISKNIKNRLYLYEKKTGKIIIIKIIILIVLIVQKKFLVKLQWIFIQKNIILKIYIIN